MHSAIEEFYATATPRQLWTALSREKGALLQHLVTSRNAVRTLEVGCAYGLSSLYICEALAGRTNDAIGHLRLAIERSPRFREFAAGDSDFDPIRDEPAFKELVP